MTQLQETPYIDDILRWRQKVEDTLRSETGWLTLTGLYWLDDGLNTVGAAPDSDVVLPAGTVDRLGVIEFHDGRATLRVHADIQVTVDGVETREAALRDSDAKEGPSIVKLGTVSFFVIRRGDMSAVRMRDSNNPARRDFAGRRWFPIDTAYTVSGAFVPYTPPRTVFIPNTVGQSLPTTIPGRVEFTLNGTPLSLEAFEASEGEVWFVFRDATSGVSTYSAARFLYAPVTPDGVVTLDFNKAYSPPCAFTDFATCPLPPPENILPVEIMAGERV